MSFPPLTNTRSEDLILLAKQHYKSACSMVEAARRIVAIHEHHDFRPIGEGDLARSVLDDLMPIVLPTLDAPQWSGLLLALGPCPVVPGLVALEGGLYAGLVRMLLGHVATLDLPVKPVDPLLLDALAARKAPHSHVQAMAA